MSVDVLQRQPASQQQHLQVVEQLRNFFSELVVALVLGSHPDFGGLFDNLFTDLVHTSVERLDSP